MATRIRLRRVGRKRQPSFRIVVIDKAKSRDGSFVELLGHYNPRTEPATIQVDEEKARAWLDRGATPSDTVRSILKKVGVFETTAEEPAKAPVEAKAESVEQAPPDAPAKTKADLADETPPDASAGAPAES